MFAFRSGRDWNAHLFTEYILSDFFCFPILMVARGSSVILCWMSELSGSPVTNHFSMVAQSPATAKLNIFFFPCAKLRHESRVFSHVERVSRCVVCPATKFRLLTTMVSSLVRTIVNCCHTPGQDRCSNVSIHHSYTCMTLSSKERKEAR